MSRNTGQERVQLLIKGDADLIHSLTIEAATQRDFQITRPIDMRGNSTLTTVIATLGSAGAFTALVRIITKLLQNRRDRELVLEYKGTKIALKGHSLPEEKEIIGCLAPEFLQAMNKLQKGEHEDMPDSKR